METNTTVTTLAEVLPYIFVAVIIIGAVAWLGMSDSSNSSSDRKEEQSESEEKKGIFNTSSWFDKMVKWIKDRW